MHNFFDVLCMPHLNWTYFLNISVFRLILLQIEFDILFSDDEVENLPVELQYLDEDKGN